MKKPITAAHIAEATAAIEQQNAAAWLWYSVSTPGVFKEYELPADDKRMTATHRRQYAELQRLAEAHGAAITASTYRRG